jgi:hypothetical protein
MLKVYCEWRGEPDLFNPFTFEKNVIYGFHIVVAVGTKRHTFYSSLEQLFLNRDNVVKDSADKM